MTLTPGKSHLTALDILLELRCWLADNVEMQAEPAIVAHLPSGYLLTQPPPGQPRLIGADASHAWVSVYCPVSGWVDFDPTNNVQPALEHITLAWGRDFSDVSPLRGVILGGGSHDPEVRVTVMPLE